LAAGNESPISHRYDALKHGPRPGWLFCWQIVGLATTACKVNIEAHISCMWSYSKNPVVPGVYDQKKPERSRAETLAKAAGLKLKRERDASQAMKDLADEKKVTLAKTARLRAARLALAASPLDEKKTKPPGV
jgi:hypothetical protein